MVRKRRKMFANSAEIFLGIFIFAFIIPFVYGHEGELHETAAENVFHQFNTTTVIVLSAVAILACTIMLLSYKDSLIESQKKIIFGIIVFTAIGSTGYLIGNTIYLNVVSWSNGLIHWHADFEIWLCGQKVVLPEPTGLTNRIGTATVHHHGDYRIHLEGVIKDREEATLGHFFDVINVPFSNERILNMENGDYCPDGRRGSVKMFINGELYEGDYSDYVIAPFVDVPPGDLIKIVFE